MADTWRIERRSKTSGTWGSWAAIETEVEIDAVDGEYTYEDDDNLTHGTTYQYRVKHVGDDSDWLESNEIIYSYGAGTGETLYVGSRADGSESVNAVVADVVFHDRPEDIDPIGYLSQIGKPKVTAVVGEEVESIPGSQLRDGLFREIPRVFSKPAAVSIAPGVFYQEVDLGNWAAGLRVYASEDMVMFIAGREIEIPKSVLLYLPWKVRTFEVRQKSAAAVGTLYIYGGC